MKLFSILISWFCCLLDKNECDVQNICLYGGSCVDTPGSYFCMCVEGRTGKNCEHGKQCDVYMCLGTAVYITFAAMCSRK